MFREEEAVTEHPEGTVIAVIVYAGAKETCLFSAYHPWRKAFECTIGTSPVEGKANRELIRHCATWFNIPHSSVRILTGQRSDQKKVLIQGKSRKEVLDSILKARR
jgi:uncharacterized protein (TIGR00251 family)